MMLVYNEPLRHVYFQDDQVDLLTPLEVHSARALFECLDKDSDDLVFQSDALKPCILFYRSLTLISTEGDPTLTKYVLYSVSFINSYHSRGRVSYLTTMHW